MKDHSKNLYQFKISPKVPWLKLILLGLMVLLLGWLFGRSFDIGNKQRGIEVSPATGRTL